jgi:hypothetical protein
MNPQANNISEIIKNMVNDASKLTNIVTQNLSEIQHNLKTDDEKKKFAEALVNSNVLRDFERLSNELKDISK